MIYKNLKKVITSRELDSTISFLKKGLKWSSRTSTNIKNSLVDHNKTLGFYGFALFNEKYQIIGAILTPYQGIFKNESIINLSAWYVLPKYRGINSIYMAKFITNQLRDHVITNFSPNEAALNIFETIGFKKMRSFTSNYYLSNYFNSVLKILLATKKQIHIISKLSPSKRVNKSQDSLLLRDSFYITIKIQKKELEILINKSKVERKLGLVIISLPRIHILWSSNNSLLNKNLSLVIPFLMVKYISPIVSNHCNDSRFISQTNIWRYHLQYSQKINFLVPPTGGEYSINY